LCPGLPENFFYPSFYGCHARDSHQVQPADTNGLEDLFDVSSVQAVPDYAQGTASKPEGCSLGIAHWLTVEEAAKRLDISPNAVIKRLGKGKLAGQKIPGQFGEKWLVDPAGLPQEIQVDFAATNDENAEAVPGTSRGTASAEQEQPAFDKGIAQKSIDVLAEVIRQQTEQIRLQNELSNICQSRIYKKICN